MLLSSRKDSDKIESQLTSGYEAANPVFAVAALGAIIGALVGLLMSIFKKGDSGGGVPGTDPSSTIIKNVAKQIGQPNIKMKELSDNLVSLKNPPTFEVKKSYIDPESYISAVSFIVDCDSIFLYYIHHLNAIVGFIEIAFKSEIIEKSFQNLEETVNTLLPGQLAETFFKIKKAIDSKRYYEVYQNVRNIVKCVDKNGINIRKDKIIQALNFKFTGEDWTFDKEKGLSWFNNLSMEKHGFGSVGASETLPKDPQKLLSSLQKSMGEMRKKVDLIKDYYPNADILKYLPEINRVLKFAIILGRNAYKGRVFTMSLFPIREIAKYANTVQKEYKKEQTK